MDFSKDTELDKAVMPVQRSLSCNSDTSSEATAMSEDKPEFQWLLLWKDASYFDEATSDKIDEESASGGDVSIEEYSVDEEPEPCPYNFPRGASKWHPGHKRHCDCRQCWPEGADIDAESGLDVEDEEESEEDSEEESDVEEDSEEEGSDIEEDDEDIEVEGEDVEEEEDIEDDFERQYVEERFEEVYERVPLFDEIGAGYIEAETLEVKEPAAKRMKFDLEEVRLADFLPEKFIPESLRDNSTEPEPSFVQRYEGNDESLLYEGIPVLFLPRF